MRLVGVLKVLVVGVGLMRAVVSRALLKIVRADIHVEGESICRGKVLCNAQGMEERVLG
jgi:hypothetical protein